MRKLRNGDYAKISKVDAGGWTSLIGKTGRVITDTPNKDGKIELDFENGWIGWHKPENLVLDVNVNSILEAIQVIEDRQRIADPEQDFIKLEKVHASGILRVLYNIN